MSDDSTLPDSQGAGSEPAPVTPALAGEPCVVCGYVTIKLHCKERCSQCGAIRDCSDL